MKKSKLLKHKYIFITGTDTNVGKTIASAFLCSMLNSNYYKPIQSGILYDDDTKEVVKICNLNKNNYIDPLYKLKQPLSPHLSAEIDKLTIDYKLITLPKFENNNTTLIEGAGGLMVPINYDGYMMIDLIKQLSIPTILVARSSLGTINHTLLSLKLLKDYNINNLGVLLMGDRNEENAKDIINFGKTRIIAQIPNLNKINLKEFEKIKLEY